MQQNPSPTRLPSRKILLRILRITNSFIIGLLTIWLIFSNLLAAQQETILQAELNQFSQRFPKTEANSSAIQLDELITLLGLQTLGSNHDHALPSEADRQSYEAIRQPLREYLNAQIIRPNDHIDELPESIRQYFKVHAIDLSAIRDHLLRNEVPRWESVDFQQTLTPLFTQPVFTVLIDLQNLLLIDTLQTNRLGQFQQTLDNLTASWKLNQSLYKHPRLIPFLVALTISNKQTGVLRKINRLPPTWQPQIPDRDMQKSLLTVSEAEAFVSAELLRTYSLQGENFWQSINSVYQDLRADDGRIWEQSPLAKFQQIFQQPYFRLVAAHQRSTLRRLALDLSSQNICALDNRTWLKKNAGSWWYSLGEPEATLNQWQKAYRNLINRELTRKVLQVKALVAQSGQAPQTIPGFEQSTVCSNLRWKYQFSTDGTMSISLQSPPQWLVTRTGDLPSYYQLRLADIAKQN